MHLSPQTLQSQPKSSLSKLHISGQNEVNTQNRGHRVMMICIKLKAHFIFFSIYTYAHA